MLATVNADTFEKARIVTKFFEDKDNVDTVEVFRVAMEVLWERIGLTGDIAIFTQEDQEGVEYFARVRCLSREVFGR